jgi:hypothetical protein
MPPDTRPTVTVMADSLGALRRFGERGLSVRKIFAMKDDSDAPPSYLGEQQNRQYHDRYHDVLNDCKAGDL